MHEPRPLILRARLHHAGTVLVTHTLHATTARVTLACGRPIATGETVRISLSFPGLVDEFDVIGRAVARDAASGHGLPASVTFDIVEASGNARDVLERIVALRSLPPPQNAGPADQPFRCLLVEDNAFIRDIFAFALEKYCADHGARVRMDTAISAEDAWAALSRDRYDIAVIDHFLPKETGAQLIARVRADPTLGQLAIVAVSVGGAVVRDAAIGAGADLFLDKPLAMRELFTTLDGLTRRRGG